MFWSTAGRALLVLFVCGLCTSAPQDKKYSISSVDVAQIVDEMVAISDNMNHWITQGLAPWQSLAQAIFGRVLSGPKLVEVAMSLRNRFEANKRNLKTTFLERVPGAEVFVPGSASTPVRGGEQRHCRCGQPSHQDEPMVHCDRCQQWYHLACEQIELHNLGRRRYSCRNCRGYTARNRPSTPSILRDTSEIQPGLMSELPSIIVPESPRTSSSRGPLFCQPDLNTSRTVSVDSTEAQFQNTGVSSLDWSNLTPESLEFESLMNNLQAYISNPNIDVLVNANCPIGGENPVTSEGQDRLPFIEIEMREPSMEIEVQEPSFEVEVRHPTMEIEVQQPSSEIEVRHPTMEIEVQQPSFEVEVRQPIMDIEVQQPSLEVEVHQPGFEIERTQPRDESEGPSPQLEIEPSARVDNQNTTRTGENGDPYNVNSPQFNFDSSDRMSSPEDEDPEDGDGHPNAEQLGPENFSIEVTPAEWSDFWDANKSNLLTRKWTELIVHKIREASGNRRCVLQNKDRTLRRPGVQRTVGYWLRAVFLCKHNNYGCFRYTLIGSWVNPGVRFEVRRDRTYHHQPFEQFARQVKHRRRRAFAEAMKQKSATTFASELHADADLELIASGNAESIPSRKVLKNIRNEQLCTEDYAEDAFEDVDLMRRDERVNGFTFIRECAKSEMMVIAFFDAQILILKALRAMGPVVAHIDATGKVLQPFDDASKRIYLYALTVTCPEPGHPPLALMEFATSEHNINRLTFCMRKFSDRCHEVLNLQRGEQIFSRVELDFSQALLQAAMFVFCSKYTLEIYLKRCWKHLLGRRNPPPTLVHGCQSHFIKMLLNQFNAKLPTDEAKEQLRDFVYSFVHASKFGSVYRRVRLLFMILLSENRHSLIEHWLAQLHSATAENYHAENREIWENFQFEEVQPTRIHTNTHFGQFFHRLADSCRAVAREYANEGSERNPFYCPALMKYLLQDVLPYTPIFTSVMFPGANDDGREANQWAVEHWWRIVKVEELIAYNIRLATKAGRYFRRAKAFLAGRIKEFAAAVLRVVALRNANQGVPGNRGRARGRGKQAAEKYAKQATGAVLNGDDFRRDVLRMNKELNASMDLLRKRSSSTADQPSKKRRRFSNKNKNKTHQHEENWHRGGQQIPNNTPRATPYTVHDIHRIIWARGELDSSGFYFDNTCPIDNILNDLSILYRTNQRFAGWLSGFPNFLAVVQDVLNGNVNAARAAWLRLANFNPVPGMDVYGDIYSRESVPLSGLTGNYQTRVVCPIHGQVRRIRRNLHNHQRTSVALCLQAITDGLDELDARCPHDNCRSQTSLHHEETQNAPPIINFPLAHGPAYGVSPEPPSYVTYFGRRYQLFSRRIQVGAHFISNFYLDGRWWIYDGMNPETPAKLQKGADLTSVLYVLVE